MEAVAILRQLWRQRFLLAVGFALALAIATLLTYSFSGFPPKLKSRQYVVGVSTASVLVDSASSQVADLGGEASRADVASLSVRARLLAELLATSPLREQIASRAGIAAETLVAIAPQDSSLASGSTPSAGNTLDADDRRASVLNISVRESVPILTAAVTAPDRETAARLAGGAIAELEEYLGSVASTDRVPDARRLVVEPLGTAHTASETRGPRRLLTVAVMIVFFGLWCVGLLAFQGFTRGWRRAAALESEEAGGLHTAEPARRPGLKSVPAAESLALPERVRSAPTALEPLPQQLPELPERPVRRGGRAGV
jgi:hypothetical protein